MLSLPGTRVESDPNPGSPRSQPCDFRQRTFPLPGLQVQGNGGRRMWLKIYGSSRLSGCCAAGHRHTLRLPEVVPRFASAAKLPFCSGVGGLDQRSCDLPSPGHDSCFIHDSMKILLPSLGCFFRLL